MPFFHRHRCQTQQYSPEPSYSYSCPQVITVIPACPQPSAPTPVPLPTQSWTAPLSTPGEDILQRTGEHAPSNKQSTALEGRAPGKPENNTTASLKVLDRAAGEYKTESFRVEYDKEGKVRVEKNGKEVKHENLAFYADGKLYKADGTLLGEMGIRRTYTEQLKTSEIIQADATLRLNNGRYQFYSPYSLTLDDNPLVIINRPPPGTVRVYERQEVGLLNDTKAGGLAIGSERPSSYSIRWVSEKNAEKYFRGASEYTQESLRELFIAKEKAGEVAKDGSFEVRKGVRAHNTKDGFQIRFSTNIPTTLIGDDGLTKAPGRMVADHAPFAPKQIPENRPPEQKGSPELKTPSTSDSPPLLMPQPPISPPVGKSEVAPEMPSSPPVKDMIVPPPVEKSAPPLDPPPPSSPPVPQTPSEPPVLSPPPDKEPLPKLSLPVEGEKPKENPSGKGLAEPTPSKLAQEDPNKKWRDVEVRYGWMKRYKQSPFIEQEGFTDIKKSSLFSEEEKGKILSRCREAFEESDLKDMKVGFWYRRSQNMGHHLMLCKADQETFVMDVVTGGLCNKSDLYTRNNLVRIYFRKDGDSWSVHIRQEKGNDGKQGYEAVAKEKLKDVGVLSPRLALAADKSSPLEEFNPMMEWGPKIVEPRGETKTSDRPTRDPFWAGSTVNSRDLTETEINSLKDKTVAVVSAKGAPDVEEEKDDKGRVTKVTVEFVMKKDGSFGPNSSYNYMGGDKRARVFIHDKGVLVWTEADNVQVWEKSFGTWRTLGNAKRTNATGDVASPWERSILGAQNKLVTHLESFFEPQDSSK